MLIQIVFGGDVDLGDSYHTHKEDSKDSCILYKEGYVHSFVNLRTLLSSSDFLISNLESPIDTNHNNNKLSKIKRYIHWVNPEKAMRLFNEIGFNAFSLSNNHILDQGEEGLNSTFTYLQQSNIRFFGAGLNLADAEKPLSIDTSDRPGNIYIIGGYQYNEIYDKRYKFYAGERKSGVNSIQIDRLGHQVKTIRRDDPYAFIIFFPHWGGNYMWASDEQKMLGEQLIRLGIDLIIGHGAHSLQEVGYFQSKYILYNIGNLVMNSPGRYRRSPTLPYSMIVKLNLSRFNGKYDVDLKLYPLLSDNRKTNYQPRLVNNIEIEHIKKTLLERAKSQNELLVTGKDNYGYYIGFTN